jgi:uncharacterized protein (DUF58 family)
MTLAPTRRAALLVGVAAALSLAPAMIALPERPVWLFCLVAPALALIADTVLCAPAAGLGLEVRMPDSLSIGEAGEAVLVLAANGWAHGGVVEVLCDLDPLFAEQPSQRVRVPARGAAHVHLPLVARRRGSGRLARAWLRWTGPLGLVVRQEPREVGRRVSVAPNVRGVRAAALHFSAQRDFLVGPRVARHAGEGSEFESLREYGAGLDLRAVDWKASARHARMVGREYRAERRHQVVLCIDTGHLMSEPLRGMPRLDHAINAALLVGYVALKTGDRLALFAFDERPRLYADVGGAPSSFAALRRRVADLDYTTAETNFTLGLIELDQRLRRRSLLIVLTEFVDTVTAELMVEHLGRLARHHVVVFVTLRDPDVQAVAAAAPSDLLGLSRAVAARDLVRERDVVLSRLRRHGVLLVDAPPEAVSTGLVNRYLELKRRERL